MYGRVEAVVCLFNGLVGRYREMMQLTKEGYDMVVFVNSIRACFVANYLAENTLAVPSPKFGDRTTHMCFDDERSHSCEQTFLTGFCLESIHEELKSPGYRSADQCVSRVE